jgi:hypothetical protein
MHEDACGVDSGGSVDDGRPISDLRLDKNIDVRRVPGGVMLVMCIAEVGVPRGPGVTGDTPARDR